MINEGTFLDFLKNKLTNAICIGGFVSTNHDAFFTHLETISYDFGFWIYVSHEEPGAADHSSVDRDVFLEPILSTCRTESLYT